MFNSTKIALSLALVLGTASATMAATKHPDHGQRTAVARQVPASAFGANASANRVSGRLGETGAILIQDRDNGNAGIGTPYCGGKC